jgi:YfiR/HmsC-like
MRNQLLNYTGLLHPLSPYRAALALSAPMVWRLHANWWRITVASVIVFLFLAPRRVPARMQADEYRVKAAFLFHFAQLVDWPPESLGPGDRQLIFCTLGEPAESNALESIVEGKQIGSHPIKVQHLRESDDLRSCRLLYILILDKKHVGAILARLENASTLTVGESEDFVQQGGMIGFALQDKKIRFNINLQSAQHANLKISSRLLLLAKSVVGDPGQG